VFLTELGKKEKVHFYETPCTIAHNFYTASCVMHMHINKE